MNTARDLLLVLSFTVVSIMAISCAAGENEKGLSSGMELQAQSAPKKHPLAELPGFEVYKKNCRICHGMDGDKGLGGAKNLKQSVMSLEERLKIIRQGKGTMKPYQGVLSGEEIEAVAGFIEKLRTR